MKRHARVAIVLTALLAATASSNSGQQISPTDGAVIGLSFDLAQLIGEPHESDSEISTVNRLAAQYALPLRIRQEKGTTLEQTIRSTCMFADNDYFELVEERLIDLNPHLPAETAGLRLGSTDQRDVVLPYCIRRPEPTVKEWTSSEGDTLWKTWQIARRRGEVEGTRPLTEVAPAVRAALDEINAPTTWASYERAFQRLNPRIDPEVLALNKTFLIPVIPTPEISIPLPASNLPILTQALRSRGIETNRFSQDGLGTLDEVLGVDLANSTCSGQGQPFDVLGVVEQLAENEELRRRYDLPEARSPHVLAADTGLGYLDGLPALGSVLEQSLQDTRRDGEWDPRFDQYMHGLYVASMALGGPDFLPFNSLLREPVLLDSFTLVEAAGEFDSPSFIFPKERISAAAERSIAVGHSTVVNVSVRWGNQLDTFRNNYIASNNRARSLFVVAAGNHSSPMTTGDWYPARYGGDPKNNLITVTALDGASLAPFSNHNNNYIDIAAQGCGLEVLHPSVDQRGSFIRVRRSGTSLAAPLVSFAAALVRREISTLAASEVKRRILYSARLDPDLTTKVKEGRVLDIQTAIAVFTDTVILKDGSKHQGRVDFTAASGETIDFCGNARELGRLALKRLAASTDSLHIEWEDGDGTTLKENCQPLPGNILITEPFSKRVTTVEGSSVQDIVFASRPYWIN